MKSSKGLNLCLTSTKDKKHLPSNETKNKISESNKGEKCFWYGKTFTEETKSKMRTRNKFLKFFKQLFCKHRWVYNYKKGYHRCKNCELKIEDYENN